MKNWDMIDIYIYNIYIDITSAYIGSKRDQTGLKNQDIQ